MIGIYAINNIVNNKKYIGSSIDIRARWNKHISQLRLGRHYKYLQNSFDKYGESNFELIILEECSEDELLDREDYYILLYNTIDRRYGYNYNLATRRNNYTHSKETRDKISQSQMGKSLSEEHRRNISKGNIGKHFKSKEEREHLRRVNRRKFMSEEIENEIRKLLIKGVRANKVAEQFGFSKNVTMRIKRELEDEGLILSRKERDFLIKEDLCRGLSVKDISKKYNVSETTVRNKRRELLNNGTKTLS